MVVVTFLNGFITKPSVKSILTTCHALPLCLIIFSRGMHTQTHTQTHTHRHTHTDTHIHTHTHTHTHKSQQKVSSDFISITGC